MDEQTLRAVLAAMAAEAARIPRAPRLVFGGCSIQCPPAGRTAEYPLDFGPFDGRVWLNSAHQGPIPKVAAEAARRAVEQKSRPFLIQNDDFFLVPVRLRTVLGKLINANPDDIILGNSRPVLEKCLRKDSLRHLRDICDMLAEQ